MVRDIVLALGAGGAKGNAHIGVIRVLEREGFNIRAIAGTSAGGLWGSLFAFGYSPDEIQRRMISSEVAALFTRDPEDSASWFGLRGVRAILQESMGDCRFEDLHIPFAVTAVDLNTAEHVVLKRGSVVNAVMATIAVPGIFPPQRLNGRVLIDGGILDPVPVITARALARGLPVVAVALSPTLETWEGDQKPRLLNSLPFVLKYVETLRFTRALNVLLRSIDISGVLLSELLLQVNPPDVIIRPEVGETGLLDFNTVDRVVASGERAAEAMLPELERVVSWRSQLARRLKIKPRPARMPYYSCLLDDPE
jgi:NTE family protein